MTTVLLFVLWIVGAMIVYRIIDIDDGDTFDSWYMIPFLVGMVAASWLSLAVWFVGLVVLVAFACLWWVAKAIADGFMWFMNKTMSLANTLM
jgi:hypothetical protein